MHADLTSHVSLSFPANLFLVFQQGSSSNGRRKLKKDVQLALFLVGRNKTFHYDNEEETKICLYLFPPITSSVTAAINISEKAVRVHQTLYLVLLQLNYNFEMLANWKEFDPERVFHIRIILHLLPFS